MKLTTKLLLGATLIAGLSISAFAACASDVDFGSTDGTNGKNITGLKDPINSQDAATKGYVDDKVANIISVNVLANESNLSSYASIPVSGTFSIFVHGGCYGASSTGSISYVGILSGNSTSGASQYTEVALGVSGGAFDARLVFDNVNDVVNLLLANSGTRTRICKFNYSHI